MPISTGRSSRFVLGHVEEIFAGVALVLVIVSVCWGVVTRYITETPAVWTTEVARDRKSVV